MLKKYYILVFLFVLATVSQAGPVEQLLKAQNAYDAKNYKLAIETYESLIKEGYVSGNVYYNLGNAYYRDNKLGKAIYNYELAKKMDPNDEDVKNNLNIAYSKTIDKIETKENFFVSAVKTNVLSSFSTRAWAWLSVAIIFVAMLFLYLFIAGSSVKLKRFSFFISLVGIIAFFIVYFLGYSAVKAKQQTKFAIITAQQSKVYTEPTVTASSKFGLHEGTRVKIIELNADWVLIKLENGNEGWLKTTEVGVF